MDASRQKHLGTQADDFWKDFSKNRPKYSDTREEGHPYQHLSDVRCALLGRQHSSPHDLHLQSERQRGMDLAQSLGVWRLRRKSSGRVPFPWNIVTDELIDVKDRQREAPCWKVGSQLLKAMQHSQA